MSKKRKPNSRARARARAVPPVHDDELTLEQREHRHRTLVGESTTVSSRVDPAAARARLRRRLWGGYR